MSRSVFSTIEANTVELTSQALGVENYEKYDVTPLILPNGMQAPWEPEESIVFYNPKSLHNIKTEFSNINDLQIVKGFRDFTYFTMYLPSKPGEILRARTDISGDKFDGLSACFKTAGKASATRQEWEVDMAEFSLKNAASVFLERYPNMPNHLLGQLGDNIKAQGIMVVKRAGFNAIHVVKDGIHKHVVHYSASTDIGRILTANLAPVPGTNSPTLGKHTEFEAEVIATSSNVKGVPEQERREVITSSLDYVWGQIKNYNDKDQIHTGRNKTETIKDAVQQHLTPQEIEITAVKPHEYPHGKRLGAKESYRQTLNRVCNEMPATNVIHAYAKGESDSLSRAPKGLVLEHSVS